MIKYISCVSFLMAVLITKNTFGQTKNAYQFIEPNISIAYDSNVYKIAKRYSNASYETESYDFKSIHSNPYNVSIHIKANHPIPAFVSVGKLDSLMTLRIDDVKKIEDDEISVVESDKKVRHIKDFSCLGAVMVHNKKKTYFATVMCNRMTSNDLTEIQCAIVNCNNLDSIYRIAEDFLTGFTSYSPQQIADEEDKMKHSYTVTVHPASDTIDNFKWRPKTYLGMVKTKELLQHTVKAATIDFGSFKEVFTPEPNGEVPILCNDKEKGKIERKGNLILLNSFGKRVKLPFSFTYTNH